MIGKQKGVVLAGVFGNALEWYDFTVYAFFVPVLAKQFFPVKDAFLSIVATLSVFALGFLVRPFGGIFFGYIGDHIGRKKALILSIIMMSVPTFFVGLLPDYAAIGIAAPLLLTLLRLIQGLAVSGELTTATVFLIEHADKHRRGLAGCLAMCSALVGIVSSSAFASLVSGLVTDTQLNVWGWRIPFIIGGVIGIVGLLIRLKSIEPQLYEETLSSAKKKARPSILKHILSLRLRTVSSAIALTSIMAICNYFLIGYFNTFLIKNQGLPLRSVMVVNLIALVVQTILTLFMGLLSDYWGRKRVLAMGMVGLIIFSYPIFILLTQHNIYHVLAGEVLFAMMSAAIAGVIPTTLAEMFDTYHRNLGISMSYNMSLALFGGTTPLIAISLVTYTHNAFAPVWYIILGACIGLFALVGLPESYRKKLQ